MSADAGWHQCHFCGEDVNRAGYAASGERHFLSDCRPDLVEHVIGPLCTWPATGDAELDAKLDRPGCYAYQIFFTGEWTEEHSHFHTDGPM